MCCKKSVEIPKSKLGVSFKDYMYFLIKFVRYSEYEMVTTARW